MSYISETIRRKIAQNAKYRCEYCCTSQRISGGQMHIEHIISLASGGTSDPSNLCYSCAWCNSFKGAKIHAYDPLTGLTATLFNPRTQLWNDHFCWREDGIFISGLTPTGRATVAALQMNNEYILPARHQWVIAGWHPPV